MLFPLLEQAVLGKVQSPADLMTLDIEHAVCCFSSRDLLATSSVDGKYKIKYFILFWLVTDLSNYNGIYMYFSDSDRHLMYNPVSAFFVLVQAMLQGCQVNQEALANNNAVPIMGALLQKVHLFFICAYKLK